MKQAIAEAVTQMLAKYWLFLFLTGVVIGAMVAHVNKISH